MQANHLTSQTLHRFFKALTDRDEEGIANCYAHGVRFEDPVFSLSGQRDIMGMWALLFGAHSGQTKSTPLQAPARREKPVKPPVDVWRLDFHTVTTLHNHGSVRWEPVYRYAPTGRLVHNIIFSQFHFDEDGLILSQRDNFDFWRWARQAYGFVGLMLGWTPLLWDQAREQADVSLQEVLTERRRQASLSA